jgi:hypothetical protein
VLSTPSFSPFVFSSGAGGFCVLGAASFVLLAPTGALLLPFFFLFPFFLLLEAGPEHYRDASFPISANARSEEAKGGDVAWHAPQAHFGNIPWAADWTELDGPAEEDMVPMQLAVLLSPAMWLLRTCPKDNGPDSPRGGRSLSWSTSTGHLQQDGWDGLSRTHSLQPVFLCLVFLASAGSFWFRPSGFGQLASARLSLCGRSRYKQIQRLGSELALFKSRSLIP